MGKWTLGYHDEVLSSKIKSLVSGAIKRSKLDKTEPQISFERFVAELDAGDSFTSTLVEILVKELADRQTRSNPDDRRLIGERTSKSLRLLINPIRVYSTSSIRRTSSRRSHLPMYINNPADEMELDDDDEEFESMLEGTEPLRRTAPPISGPPPSVIPYRSTSPTPLTPTDESLPALTYSHSTWVPPRSYVTTGHGLTRSSSIRRPTRSRTVDFNDFTSHRRRTTRNNTTDTGGATNADAPTDNPWSPPSVTRRFFSGLRNRRIDPEGTLLMSTMATLDGEDAAYTLNRTNLDTTPVGTETSDERTTDVLTTTTTNPLPTLRRGGLRAPESLLSRQVSPADTIVPNGDGDSRRAPSPPEISEYILDSPRFRFSSIPRQEPDGGATFGLEIASYPTPGSTIDNENATSASTAT